VTAHIFILNGPNLDRLGTREPEIYGYDTLASIEQRCSQRAAELDVKLTFRQTNFEGEMVQSIHDAIDNAQGLIINPAGFSFLSIPVCDALKMFGGPKIELHLTNIYARADITRDSIMSGAVTGVVAGLGPEGYLNALDWMGNAVTKADS